MNHPKQKGADSGMVPSQKDWGAVHAHGRIEDLIARCAIGDRRAFEALYDATSGKLFAVCGRVLGTPAAAEDAMQDAYITIWKNSGRYHVTGHSPMTWLITIARNTAIDRARAQRRDMDMPDLEDAVAASAGAPEHPAIAASGADRLGQCLDTLPEDRRAALEGAYLQGLGYADLADRAGMPVPTMRTWLRHALIALRECMRQ